MDIKVDSLISFDTLQTDLDHVLSIAEKNGKVILLKDNKPVYVITKYDEFKEVEQKKDSNINSNDTFHEAMFKRGDKFYYFIGGKVRLAELIEISKYDENTITLKLPNGEELSGKSSCISQSIFKITGKGINIYKKKAYMKLARKGKYERQGPWDDVNEEDEYEKEDGQRIYEYENESNLENYGWQREKEIILDKYKEEAEKDMNIRAFEPFEDSFEDEYEDGTTIHRCEEENEDGIIIHRFKVGFDNNYEKKYAQLICENENKSNSENHALHYAKKKILDKYEEEGVKRMANALKYRVGDNFEDKDEYNRRASSNANIIDKIINEDVEFLAIMFKATSVEEVKTLTPEYGSTTNAKVGTKFIIINAEITNITKEKIMFNTDFTLVDNEDAKFIPYNPKGIFKDAFDKYRILAPNIKEKGKLVYNVPITSNAHYITSKKDGTNDVYRILMKEDSV